MSREAFIAALRDHTDRAIGRKSIHSVVGVVEGTGANLKVHIPEHDFTLEADDILLSHHVAQFDSDYGIDVGDSLVLVPSRNGDFTAVGVMTGTEPTKRGPAVKPASGGPPAAGEGEDGDWAIDPATGAMYGPKAGGAWPALPLAVGGGAGIRYLYSSDTASSDPTSGKVKFDTVTLASITSMRISETDRDGHSLAAWLATFDDSTTTAHRGTLIITRDGGAPTNVIILDVVGTLTDNGTWDIVPVAVLASSGAFANGDPVRIMFSRTGDTGAAGAGGATGPTGPGGVRYIYSNDVALTDPTSGRIKFNSTTLASINSVRISETDADGNALAALLATIDDSTTLAHRGVLLVFKDGAPATMLALDVTSGLTDNGTWDNFTVAVLASGGSFVNGDSVHVHFFRTGDTGPSGGAPLAYGEITATVPVSGTAAAQTVVVTATSFVADGVTPVWVEFFTEEATSAGNDICAITIWEGGTQLDQIGQLQPSPNAFGTPIYAKRRFTPAIGTRTYQIRAFRVTTDGSIIAGVGGAGAAAPAFIRVTNDNNAGPPGATGLTGATGPSGPPGAGGIAIGAVIDWGGPARSIPPLYVACFGQSLLRSTYLDLFNVLCPIVNNFTVTIAAPGVFTTPAPHGLVVGDAVFLTSTAALPTGLVANTTYYVMTVPTGSTFTLGTTRSIVAATGVATVSSQITTTGTQSGTHSLFHSPHGVADSTHFNAPDYRGRVGIGKDDMGGSAAGQLTWTKVPGLKAGESAHLLLAAESGLVDHSHLIIGALGNPGGATLGFIAAGVVNDWNTAVSNSGNANAASSHNTVPPGMFVEKIIYAGPIDTSTTDLHSFLLMGV